MTSLLDRLFLLLRCFAYRLRRGRAVKPLTNPRSVVIVQLAKLGDTVCVTPVFRAIKKNYPACRVTVVGSELNRRVLEYNPDVDAYVVWSKDLRKLTRLFRDGAFDFGCLLGPDPLSLAAMYLAGVKTICVPTYTNGWTPYETISYRLLSRLVIKTEQRIGAYAPGEYLKLLAPLGIEESDTKKFLFFSQAAGKRADELLSGIKKNNPQSFLVGIVAGAGNKIKQWGPEKFAAVADHLIERYRAWVVVIGGRDNIKESRAMIDAMRHPERSLDTTGQLSLDELKALVSRLGLFISVDTGPIYFAEAFDVPTIDIVGPIDENEQVPRGERHLVVLPEKRGAPSVHGMNAHHYDAAAIRQIRSISAAMVISAADRLMLKINQ